ncbi:MAG: polyamine aminopropyltransferase [Planctomycetota bacterium]
MTDDQEDSAEGECALSRFQIATLLVSVMVVAICGIAYELIIAAVSSYLIGNGVLQFSLTIGLFMLAMGIGSLISQRISHNLVAWFIGIEIVLAVLGGWSSSLLFWAFPGYSLFRPVSWALILSIGTLVGLEIPLLTRILSRATTWRAAIANVLSLDYFGALVGSVAFPLFLLPTLGLFQSSLGVALLNAVVAIGTLLPFSRSLKSTLPKTLVGLWLGAIAATALLAAGLVGSNWLQDRAEAQLFSSNIIYRNQTPYQRIIITRNERNENIRLYLDGHLQFAEQDEYRYHESLVHPLMSLTGPRERILILGGGDGLAIRELKKFSEVRHIDLVDIDPAMTQLARQFEPLRKLNDDSLADDRVQVHHRDAFSYVREFPEQADSADRYDRVIIDLPDPHNDTLSKLYSLEFYRLLKRCMSGDGVMVCQSSSPLFTRQAFWCVAETMEAAGFKTLSYGVNVPSFGPWGFHLASQSEILLSDVSLDETRTRFLTSDKWKAATQFAADESRVAAVPNKLFEPTIYLYYLRALR